MPSVSIPVLAAGIGAAGTIGGSLLSGQAQQNAANTQLQMYNQTRQDLAPFMQSGYGANNQLMNLWGIPTGGVNTSGVYTPGAPAAGGATTSGAGSSGANLLSMLTQLLGQGGAGGTTGAGGVGTSAGAGTSGLSALTAALGGGASNGATTGATSGVPNTSAMFNSLANFPGYQFGLDQGIQSLDRSAAARGLDLSGGQLKDTLQYGVNYGLQQGWSPYISELNQLSTQGENAAAQVGQQGTTAAANAGTYVAGAGQGTANAVTQLGNFGQALIGNTLGGSSYGSAASSGLQSYGNTL